MPRGGDPSRRQLLDRVGEDRRRRPVEPVRPDERLDEAAALLGVLDAVLQDPAELLRVLVERGGDVQEAAVLLEQVVEVERALLAELRRQDGEDALADHGRLDHRGRVDPDHRRAVGERVVERVVLLGGDRSLRVARPDHGVLEAREVRVAPALADRMRAHDHARAADALVRMTRAAPGSTARRSAPRRRSGWSRRGWSRGRGRTDARDPGPWRGRSRPAGRSGGGRTRCRRARRRSRSRGPAAAHGARSPPAAGSRSRRRPVPAAT